MIWVDNITDLQYYFPNPQWGCYKDPVYQPHDILLQARYDMPLNLSNIIDYEINICQPDGTLIETLGLGNPYFDIFHAQFVYNGATYNYSQLRCSSYSAGMLSNVCFVINFKLFDSTGTVYFNKYTEQYKILDTFITATGVTISGNSDSIVLCGSPAVPNNCNIPNIQFVSIFDCIDSFTGDFYGDGTVIGTSFGATPFPFVKLSNLECYLIEVPKSVKRTISINNRTQRTESTDTYKLKSGDVVFPTWKKREIENMMRGARLYLNGTEYLSDGGVIFAQFGRPYNCQYVYKIEIDFRGAYEWQNMGCETVCESQSYYFLFP